MSDIRKPLLAALLSLAAAAAHAGLMGGTLTARWTYAPGGFDDLHVVTVAPTVELAGNWGQGHDLDADDHAIDVGMGLASGMGAGVVWEFSSPDFGYFGSVDVDTNFSGWDDAWVSFTRDSIRVEFAGDVSFPLFDGQIRFNLVPAPASGALAALALLAAGAARARVRRARAAVRS